MAKKAKSNSENKSGPVPAKAVVPVAGGASAPGSSRGVVEPRHVGSTTEVNEAIGLDDLARRFANKRAATAAAVSAEGKPAGTAAVAEPKEDKTPTHGEAGQLEGEQSAEAGRTEQGSDGAEQGTAEEAALAELEDLDGDGPAADGEGAEGAEEGDDGLPAKVQEAINRRIGKLVARAKEAEERALALEAKVNELGAKGAEPGVKGKVTGDNPAAQFRDERELADMEEQMRNLRRWCRRNADGGVIESAKGEREYTADEVASMAEHAEDWLERHIPKQREVIAKRRDYTDQTRKVFPWMNKPESPGRREADKVLAYVPELAGRPDAEWLAALAVLGVREYQRQQIAASKAAKGTVKPKVAAAVVPRTSSAPAPRVPKSEAEEAVRAAEKRFEASGSVDDLANRFAMKRKAREMAAS